MRDGGADPGGSPAPVPLATIAAQWGRIGCIGFGGPPAHIALLRRLCVDDRRWLDPAEFENAVAATGLLPGPASTQLAIYCAWRLRGAAGAMLGGLCFIVPGLAAILALAALFLASHPPPLVLGAAAGAAAAVPAVALAAARTLAGPSWRRAGSGGAPRARWLAYGVAGGAVAAVDGSLLVLVLVACGLVEVATRRGGARALVAGLLRHGAAGGTGGLVWVAAKVGALSYGGGFVIVPLMQHDAVTTYHWMTGTQFLDAVALGQVTPGPVVQTVAVVGYAAAGLGGGLLAATVAFAPSFVFVLAGGRHFTRLTTMPSVQGFLGGAGPAVIGAIAGAAVPLGLALAQLWQLAVLALAAAWLLGLRRPVVPAIVGAAAAGVLAAAAGAPIGH